MLAAKRRRLSAERGAGLLSIVLGLGLGIAMSVGALQVYWAADR